MKRFRWTREQYRHANQLARLFNRFLELPDLMPKPVRQYFDLWDRHRSHGDPLLVPLWQRLDRFKGDDEIPF